MKGKGKLLDVERQDSNASETRYTYLINPEMYFLDGSTTDPSERLTIRIS